MTPDSAVAQAPLSTFLNLDFHRKYVARVCAILGLESELDLRGYAENESHDLRLRRFAILALGHQKVYYNQLPQSESHIPWPDDELDDASACAEAIAGLPGVDPKDGDVRNATSSPAS